ncbi:MAG: SDR family oxidoreductase [Microgenomates group bacterium]
MKKTVLITGGSDGLGKEIARSLKDEYEIVICSDNKEKLEKTAREISVDYLVCDISSFNDCQKTIGVFIKKYQRIDCLINNAGVWIEGFLEDNNFESIKKTFEINLIGAVYMTKLVLPFMKKNLGGDIVFINSQAGFEAKAKRSVYTATKWGLNGLAKSLQKELVDFNIRVISVYPGKMKTKLFEKAGIKKDLSDAFEPKYVAKFIKEVLLMPKNILVPEIGIKNLKQ